MQLLARQPQAGQLEALGLVAVVGEGVLLAVGFERRAQRVAQERDVAIERRARAAQLVLEVLERDGIARRLQDAVQRQDAFVAVHGRYLAASAGAAIPRGAGSRGPPPAFPPSNGAGAYPTHYRCERGPRVVRPIFPTARTRSSLTRIDSDEHDHLDVNAPVGDPSPPRRATCARAAAASGAPEGRPHPLHRGQPRPPGQPRRDLRQGLGGHHAAILAGEAARSRCCGSGRARRSGEFQEIEWDEALATRDGVAGADPRRATRRARVLHRPRPEPVADRVVGAAVRHAELRGAWRVLLGQHGGGRDVHDRRQLLGVRRAGLGARAVLPDVRGVAEDHDSNPIKLGLGKLKARGAKFVSVNPVRTGYSAIADEWIGIRPGTDGLLVLALMHELLRADKVDLDYLVRYTNAPWLVIAGARRGRRRAVRARRATAGRCAATQRRRRSPARRDRRVARASSARSTLPDGRRAVPVFQLLAERYLDPRYAPDAVAARCGIDAATIRRLARRAGARGVRAGDRAAEPWTDWAGRRHETMRGPAGGDARDARHLGAFERLPDLPRAAPAADAARRDRYARVVPLQAAVPAAVAAGSNRRRARRVAAGQPLGGAPLGYPTGPEDLLVDAGRPAARASTRRSRWEAPLAAHGMMHMVIRNAWRGDPYPIDTLFMFMANMALELGDEHRAARSRMLTDKDAATGEYRIPHIIYSDAYCSEMVAYADLVLPDTTYLERWDCISLLDRPIGDADGAGRRDPPAGARARPRRAAVPGRADRSRRAARPAGHGRRGRQRRAIPAATPTTWSQHERTPGIGPLAGWRGADGDEAGVGRAEPAAARALHRERLLLAPRTAGGRALLQARQQGYLECGERAWASSTSAEPIVLQLYCEPLQSFRLAAQGPRRAAAAGTAPRARSRPYFDPLPIWYAAVRGGAQVDAATFPLHAITQRPMPMYHSWGSQNAWLRQIPARQPPLHPSARPRGARARRRRLGVASTRHARPHQGAGAR